MGKIVIDLGFANLIAEEDSTLSPHPQLTVSLENKKGEFIQDIALISQAVKPGSNDLISDSVRCLLWRDNEDEDYTDEFVIEKYNGEGES